MDRKELSAAIAAATGLSQHSSEEALRAALGAIAGALARGEAVRLNGFGTFQAVDRSPRVARNLNTGEAVAVPGKKVAAFRPSPALNAALEEKV